MNLINNLFSGLNTLQRALVVAIISIIVYSLSAGVSYSLISASLPDQSAQVASVDIYGVPLASGIIIEDPKEPRTEACPIDGDLHTKQAKDAWDDRRPLGVMVENHVESRSQSGLSSADVIYEAVAEGGITRFLAIFYCNLGDIQIGPVRSARTYFLDWISEYNGLYAHVGGANTPGPANSLGQIIDYDIKDLNQFSIGFPTFWRDYQRLGRPVATEHTMYSTTQKLWAIGAKKGWTAIDSTGARWDAKFIAWKFKDGSPGSDVKKINVSFWENQRDYAVEWNYDETCNCYKRKQVGNPHIDLNTKQQLAPKNVIVQFQRESRANDGYENNVHLLYANNGSKGAGSGKALIFQDGKVIEGQWQKANRLSREKFVDKAGKEVSLNRGQIWIQTVPEGSEVKY